ncbi:metal ABC transporter permease [Suttonella sp. R2A3]|uniref:metal ABC transporter permease n=1 Tax=Suttonella sp. R2A3 TaxID=2908648 RepID=UPI001F4230D8|nr:metal ABC transporter permease [Suttonella sp. R2A3]UJF24644.1 metal ABC transporter permease [Suttonella sp. R2A3]
MIELLSEPFTYNYMVKAMAASALVGTVCALLSVFLMLKGWSLIGDALSHAVVPGVAGAYALGLPYTVGAFFTGFLAATAILALNQIARLKQDAVIGFVFSSFFAAGLLLISLNPTSINITAIIYGNILGMSDADLWQIIAISALTLLIIALKWRDFMLLFFDETQAVASGLAVNRWKVIFFAMLSAAIVASLQAVGAILVIALVITPGATAYLISDRFGRVLIIAMVIGFVTSLGGAYLSYFIDGVTGAIIVVLQTVIFLLVFAFSPKYGVLARQWRQKKAVAHG